MTGAPRPIPMILGPTGAGKTDLALRLADRLPIEIISVDSAMVYRGMDIGTGKPCAATLQRHPHHLVDILDPSQSYSAGAFVRDATRLIDAVLARGRLPLLVGGTMLYFRALRRGIAEMPAANRQIRAMLDADAGARGWPALHQDLAAIDPVAARRIGPQDAQRIQRALEVHRVSGKTLSELHAAPPAAPRLDLQFVAFAWSPSERALLYDAIERRLAAMMSAGFLEEVRRLRERGDLHADLPAIRSVGYRQLWEHVSGRESLDSAVQRAIFATRQLARRQLIWLRSESELTWTDPLDSSATAHMEQRIAMLCS